MTILCIFNKYNTLTTFLTYVISYILVKYSYHSITAHFSEILVVYILQQWGLIVEENLQFKYSVITLVWWSKKCYKFLQKSVKSFAKKVRRPL